MNFRDLVNEQLIKGYFPHYPDLIFNLLVLVWIGLCALVLHFLLHSIVLRLLSGFHFLGRKGGWLQALTSSRFFRNLILIVQAIVVQIQLNTWLDSASLFNRILSSISDLFIMFYGLMALFSVLDAGQNILDSRASKLLVPMRGAIQTAKIVLSLVFALLSVAILLGKSPLLLFSGIGAMSAVLMLIFRDPILGLVAGLQLSLNDMLQIGDWLEMPKYDADGDVIDIGLTTVKVQNWDKTITTIPTYALISDSFKNWRGMSESGGRRIKRSVLIATSSIKFLDSESIQRLKKSHLLSPYLSKKLEEINHANHEFQADMSSLINGRRLTNVGTFRHYLQSYLRSHPFIQQEMTLMVRQLESTSEGLPLQVYAFTNTTAWAKYEGIQSDIFDHIFAALPEFGLRAHEAPTGQDIRFLAHR